ncbi:heparan sulfate glucosamine 3-O-sulfotransferase 2-like [Saccoglossus kowalevskii]
MTMRHGYMIAFLSVLTVSYALWKYELDRPKLVHKPQDKVRTYTHNEIAKNRTMYIQAKFGNSCYKTQVYDTWWQTFTLPPGLKRSNQSDCQKRLPNVIIIGVKKCASDALRDFLIVHPSIVYSHAPKTYNGIKVTGSGEAHFLDRHYDHGIDFYRNLFPYSKPGDTLLEKTPQYLNFPDDVPKRIYEDVGPHTKIIAIVCDPVTRAISDYVFEKKHRFYKYLVPNMIYTIRSNFSDSVTENSRQGNIDAGNDLINVGIYAYHLVRWTEYFPLSQIHLVDGGVFRNDPLSELRRLETFLGLPVFFRNEHFFRNPDTNMFCVAFPEHRCLSKEKKGQHHPDVDVKTIDRLREFYRPYDRQLVEMFDRIFSWMDTDILLPRGRH